MAEKEQIKTLEGYKTGASLPTPAPAAAPPPKADTAPQDPSASISPSIPTRCDDIAQIATDQLMAQAMQQGQAQAGIPAKRERQEEPEIEGNRKRMRGTEEPGSTWADWISRDESLELQMVNLDQGLRDKHREIMDQANAEYSKLEMEFNEKKKVLLERKRVLEERIDRRRRGI